MPVDFSNLASTVARAGANDNLRLSGGGDQVEISGKKSFFGRATGWQSSGDAAQNKAVRQSVLESLLLTYGQERRVHPRDLKVVLEKFDVSSEKPLSARQVSRLIKELDIRKAGSYVDLHLRGEVKPLGSGQVNTVYLGNWRLDREVATKTMVFKAEPSPNTKLQPDANQIGIPEDHPHLAARNVATYELSQALGLDVIPETHFAAHQKQTGSVMALAPGNSAQGDGPLRVHTGVTGAQMQAHRAELDEFLAEKGLRIKEVGQGGSLTLEVHPESEIVQERKNALIQAYAGMKGLDQLTEEQLRTIALRGEDKTLLSDEYVKRLDMLEKPFVTIDVNDAGLRRGVNQLQWLDCLCGQADRHPGNILIDRGPDGRVSGVKGIDNDMSFGVNSDTAYANSNNPGQQPRGVNTQGKYPAVPSVIDAALHKKLVDMEAKPADAPGSIESVLKGKLSPAEIAQTRERLTQLVARLGPDDVPPNTAPEVHRVNNDAGWGSDKVTQLLDASSRPRPDGANGSYLDACKIGQLGAAQEANPIFVDMVELQAEITALLSRP